MLSRVADSIFWMSRYVERAENVARFIDVNLHLTLDIGATLPQQWSPLVQTTGDDAAFLARYGQATRSNVLQYLTFDQENPSSIVSCLRSARENARSVREIISSELWEELNKFYLMMRNMAGRTKADELTNDFFGYVKRASHQLIGITHATMSHGEAWHFAHVGRLLERADNTSRIVDVKYYILLPKPDHVGTPLDHIQWAALLKSASALEMYRKSYGRISPANVAEFLLLDPAFPRSVHFCLAQAEESMHAITGSQRGTFRNRAEQELGRLRARLDYTSLDDIMSQGLHEFIDELQSHLNRVGRAIHHSFFDVGLPRTEDYRQGQAS